MRHARHFNPEWGYVSPAPSVMRMDCLIVVAAIILAAAGAATVFSLLHRPGVKELVAAPEVSQPATAGTLAAAQQPTEPQEVKSPYVPRWGVWLAADTSESGAWALYHERVRRFASLIGDREPVVLFRQLPAMGKAKRYIIAIVDDDRGPLDKFCEKLTAAGSPCNVMRNEFGP
jgi:hypothetical protein